jgi:hypothetical protein
MARDRTSALTQRAAEALTAPAPPAPDAARDERIAAVVRRLAEGEVGEKKLVRYLVREFSVTPEQARADVGQAHEQVRAYLDSEANVDGIMLAAVARLNVMRTRFAELALQPVEDRVLDIPGVNGEPDIYRGLTAGEHASEVGARARAADMYLKLETATLAIVGKRSRRWAERPQNVVLVTGGGSLTPEQQETMERLGMSVGAS